MILSIIGTLINRKSKGQSLYSSIIRNYTKFTAQSDIAEQFNQHFMNVGPILDKLIPNTNDDPTKYINNSPMSSFYLSLV